LNTSILLNGMEAFNSMEAYTQYETI
jgi:hypothetical protein